MSNPFAVLSDSANVNVIEHDERTTDQQGFISVGSDQVLKLFEPYPAAFPASKVQHLAVHQGRIAYVTSDNKLCMDETQRLRTALVDAKSAKQDAPFSPATVIQVEAAISHIAFASDGSKLYVVAAQGGMLVYNITSPASPRQEIAIPELTDLLPNPTSEILALLGSDGELRMMINAEVKSIVSGITAISWSKKGKQIIAGTESGKLLQYTPQGDLKDTLVGPPDAGRVIAVNWLENHVFVVTYQAADDETQVYVLRRSGSQLQYTLLPNPSLPFGDTSHSTAYILLHLSKTLVLTASTTSADIGLISLTDDVALSIEEDTEKATLRFSTERETEVSIIGIAQESRLESNEKYLWCLDNDGGCSAYLLKDTQNDLFDLERSATIPNPTGSPFAASTVTNASPFSAPSTNTPSPFKAFGSTALPTASPFTAPTAQPSGFGMSSFGTTSTFGSAPVASAFGSSSLGTSSVPKVPAFGASSFGASGFGQSTFGSSSLATTGASAFQGFGSLGAANMSAVPSSAGNDEMHDSDEDVDVDDKLADIDEQEPATVSSSNPLPMGALSNLEPKSSTATPAFGSAMSFPAPLPGGFGFGTSDASKPKETSPEAKSTGSFGFSMASRSTSATDSVLKQSSAFGRVAENNSQDVDNKASKAGHTKPSGDDNQIFKNMPVTTAQVQETPLIPSKSISSSTPTVAVLKAPSSTPAVEEAAPLPPDPTTPEIAPSVEDDAPLPPDPTSPVLATADDAPLPPDPSPSTIEDAPLPPDPSVEAEEVIDDAPLPPDPSASSKTTTQDDELRPVSAETEKSPEDAPLPPDPSDPVYNLTVDDVPSKTSDEILDDTVVGSENPAASEEAIAAVDKSDDVSGPSSNNSNESFVRVAHPSSLAEESNADGDESDIEQESAQELNSDQEGSTRFESEEDFYAESDDKAGESDAGENEDDEEHDSDSEPAAPASRQKTPAFSFTPFNTSSGKAPSPFAALDTSNATQKDSKPVFDFLRASANSAEPEATTKEPGSTQSDTSKAPEKKASPFSFTPPTAANAPKAAPFSFGFTPVVQSQTASTAKTLELTENLEDKEIVKSTSSQPADNKLPNAPPAVFKPVLGSKIEPKTDAARFSFGSQAKESKPEGAKPTNISQMSIKKPEPNFKDPVPSVASKPEPPKVITLPPYTTMDSIKSRTKQPGIAGELDHVYHQVCEELIVLKDNIESINNYLQEAKDLPQSLDNVQTLSADIKELLQRAVELDNACKADTTTVSSLKSSIISLEAQKVKIQRLLRAQTDPSFSASLKVSSLAPDQVSQQRDLRRLLQHAESGLSDFTTKQSLLKSKLSAKTPIDITNISHAIHKITQSADEASREVDDLQRSFVGMNLTGTPESLSKSHRRQYSLSTSKYGSSGSGIDTKRELMRIYKETRSQSTPLVTLIK